MESMERLQYINSKHEYYLTTKTPPETKFRGHFHTNLSQKEKPRNPPTQPYYYDENETSYSIYSVERLTPTITVL